MRRDRSGERVEFNARHAIICRVTTKYIAVSRCGCCFVITEQFVSLALAASEPDERTYYTEDCAYAYRYSYTGEAVVAAG